MVKVTVFTIRSSVGREAVNLAYKTTPLYIYVCTVYYLLETSSIGRRLSLSFRYWTFVRASNDSSPGR